MPNRVRVAVGSVDAAAEYAIVDRSLNGVAYTTVRGGAAADASSGSVLLYDYEFPVGVPITYRVRTYDASDVLLDTYSDTVTATADGVWLKNVARPFLNRTVTVIGFSGVARRGRGAVLDVLGRRLPVAITEVAGSREWSLVLRAADAVEAAALDLFLTFGDTVYLEVPTGCVVPAGGHFLVTQVDSAPAPGRHDTEVRYVTLGLVEVDAPDDSIVGSTITYQGVLGAWATYGDLLVDADVPTYADLADYVSAPEDEVVG